MKRTPEACSWRSTVWVGGYAVNDGERLLQALTLLLTTIGMAAIGLGQGLLPVSLFCMIKITIMSTETRAHLAKD